MHQAPGASCDIMYILVLSLLLLMRSIHVHVLYMPFRIFHLLVGTCGGYWINGESWLAIEGLYVHAGMYIWWLVRPPLLI